MIGFKGLIPKTVQTSQSIELIIKKVEECYKGTQFCLDFFAEIAKFQETCLKNNAKIFEENKNLDLKGCYNKILEKCMLEMINQQKILSDNFKQSIDLTTQLFNKTFATVSSNVTKLELSLQAYRQEQENALNMQKKYYKFYKNLLNVMDQYKISFTDVNLIYNLDQKVKRYQNCLPFHKNVEVQYNLIMEVCAELGKRKYAVVTNFNQIQTSCRNGMKILGEIFLEKAKQFIECYQAKSNKIIEIITSFEMKGNDSKLDGIFSEDFDMAKLEIYNQVQKIEKGKEFPIIIQYHHLLKQEKLSTYNLEIEAYLKTVQVKLENRKAENKKLLQILNFFFKSSQKNQSTTKEVLISFQKKRKKISQCFGNRFVSFLKSISSVFEISAGINEKLLKNVNPVLFSLSNMFSQDSKLLKFFMEETKSNIERFSIKKEQTKGSKLQVQQSDVEANKRLLRKQIAQKAEFMRHMISGFKQKFDRNAIKIAKGFSELMAAFKQSATELNSFCCQYIELYFGNESFASNLQKYSVDFENTLKTVNQIYYQPPLNALRSEEPKISFDGDYGKVEDFKKLKKPTPIQSKSSSDKIIEDDKSIQPQTRSFNEEKFTESQKQAKNAQFLKTKISFKQKEKLIKTHSCALVGKIVLQGKIYITNERICFHSNFNSENIFFGRTFIQFPKSDIKKIEKKMSSMVLDNSIAFTTVNGQIVFTSFFSRNQTYDLICKTFEFNLDDHVYEYEENQADEIPQFLINFEEKDDIKISDLEKRKEQIDKEIPNFIYHEASRLQISEEGLNALKIFKILYIQTNIQIGNRTHQSFLKYMKDCLNHKDMEVDQWNPPLNIILNQSNIKQNAPISTSRKIRITLPMGNSGIPFMPKTAKSEEIQVLYFYSKHKFILTSSVQATGAPYLDTFKIEMRTIAESDEDGKCSMDFQYCINFVKSTMMKSIIESKTRQQTIHGCKVWTSEIKRYFQELRTRSKKSNKNMLIETNTQLNEPQIQQQALQEQNKILKEKIKQKQKQWKKWRAIAIASILFNILIIFISII